MDKNTKKPKKATRKLKPVAGTGAATEKRPTMRNVDAWITFTIGRKKVVLTVEQSGKTITGAVLINGRLTNEYKTHLPLQIPDSLVDLLAKNGVKL